MEHTYFEPEQQETHEHMTDEKIHEYASDDSTDIWKEGKCYAV